MLYEYKGKIYIKPFSNKIVEVEISKKGFEYDVRATNKKLELNEHIKKEVVEIPLEKAYKKQHKNEKIIRMI